jgi:hypothetical protein
VNYYLSSKMISNKDMPSTSKHISLNSKLNSSHLRNKTDLRENKYHYLLSSFNKSKSRYKKGHRAAEANTEILLTCDKSSIKARQQNYTSMNQYSSHIATYEESKIHMVTPVSNKHFKSNFKKNAFRSSKTSQKHSNSKSIKPETSKLNSSTHNQVETLTNNFSAKNLKHISNSKMSNAVPKDCHQTKKENCEGKHFKKPVYLMMEKMRRSVQRDKEFEELVVSNRNVFRNWRKNSLAEFFEFKSNKSLYKIKVNLYEDSNC